MAIRNLPPGGAGFGFGLRLSGSPMEAITKQAIADAKEQNPQAEPVFDVLKQVDPAPLEQMNMNQIQAELLAIPGLTSEQKEAISELPLNEQTKQQVLSVLEILQDKEESFAFAASPYAQIRFSGGMLTAAVPFAAFYLSEDTAYSMGNINLDLRFAHSTPGPASVGLGYGIHLYAPTGTERANSIALNNVLDGPAYLHEYLTPAVYMLLAADMTILSLIAHGEIVPMFAVRGSPAQDLMIYGRYGFGVGLNLALLKAQVEIAGTSSLKNAQAFETMVLLASLGFDLAILRTQIGVQLPLSPIDSTSAGALPSADFSSAPDYTVVLNMEFGF
ncbi:MAG: hypothetical protein CMH54_06850 [Myxococcales bacterium]|nr:hypothetical protein [Myxococcales bacterium]